MGYCIFCGLCVEACPRDALFLGYEYEKSCYRREELVLDKEKLLFSKENPKEAQCFLPALSGKRIAGADLIIG